MSSKGQTWAEYIIILAVVIIMAGVAMYTAGAFAGSTKHVEERDSAAYWLTADIGIARYYVNSSLSQFVIKNNKNYRIILTSITSSGSGTLVVPGGASNITLEPGQTVQVNVSGLNCSSSQYSFPLDITYTDAKYGATYSFQGEKPLVGSCMGLSPIPAPPECSSNPDCGINSTACNSYCNGNQRCSYPSNPATCQRDCVSQKCKDCNASCGNPNCISCDFNTTYCPANYCNGNTPYTYPASSSCSIPCPVNSCTSCIPPQCIATGGTDCGNTSYCSAGSCNQCTGTMRNCDLNPANGCEANLTNDTNNCGWCGNSCTGGKVCVGGTCQAITVYYQSSTNLCGYYNGTLASCEAANNFCASGSYYPTQSPSCTSSPSTTACIAENASASCAVCGNCAGGADTCNNATCGTTNSYGCGSGMYCNGGKGAGSCNAPFATGAACNCSLQCTSGVCTGGVCVDKYSSGTNLCGYYKGSNPSCAVANNFCASGSYYPSGQSCSATPTYTSCQAETAAASCAVCGNCAGGADTCNTVACGSTGYGCSAGKVCTGQGKGAAYCVALGGTGATCYCNAMCTSNNCNLGTYQCQAASPCGADCTYGDNQCHTACAGVNGCGTVQTYCEGIAPGARACSSSSQYVTCCGGTSPNKCSGSTKICCDGVCQSTPCPL